MYRRVLFTFFSQSAEKGARALLYGIYAGVSEDPFTGTYPDARAILAHIAQNPLPAGKLKSGLCFRILFALRLDCSIVASPAQAAPSGSRHLSTYDHPRGSRSP